MMKRIFQVIAILCVVLGIVGTIFDLNDQNARMKEMKGYKVVEASELQDYQAEEGSLVVVKNIHLTGTEVTDPKGLIDGKYVLLKAEYSYYDTDSEGEHEWKNDPDHGFLLMGENLQYSAFPDDKFDLEKLHFYNKIKTAKLSNDTERYEYNGLKKEDSLTALAKKENGKWKRQSLYPENGKGYVIGDENAYYDYLDAFMVGDAYLLAFAGVILGAFNLFISWMFSSRSPAKRGKEEYDIRKEERNEEKKAFAALPQAVKRKIYRNKILGFIIGVIGFALIVRFYYSYVGIAIGTVILIIGVSLFMYSSESSYNRDIDVVKMITFNKATTIEEIYEAYKNVWTPFGSAYIARIRSSKRPVLIWGPDYLGRFLYLYGEKEGYNYYLGYSPLTGFIKEHITEPYLVPEEIDSSDLKSCVCLSANAILFELELFESIRSFAKKGEVLPIERTRDSQIYTFDEAFKLTGQQFGLYDMDGRKIYQIEGTMPLKTFRIFDQNQSEVFKVSKQLANALPTYEFTNQGEAYGVLKKRFSMAKDVFDMKVSEGTLVLREFGGFLGSNFVLTLNGNPIGAIMENFELTLENIIFDNSVLVVYDESRLALLTAMAVMVAREIARDKDDARLS